MQSQSLWACSLGRVTEWSSPPSQEGDQSTRGGNGCLRWTVVPKSHKRPPVPWAAALPESPFAWLGVAC